MKDFGEYVAPTVMASVLQANFFRRLFFQVIIGFAEVAGKKVDSGLGQSQDAIEGSVRSRPGELWLAPGVSEANPNQTIEDIQNGVLAALKAPEEEEK